MITHENINPGVRLEGVEPDVIVTVAAVVPNPPSSVQVFYQRPDGTLRERLVGATSLDSVSVATERPWSFDRDGAAFKLTAEAKRIDLAFLFDPTIAVHTSNVAPLPLMMAVTDLVLQEHGNLPRQGAILVDPADHGTEPHPLFLLTHEIKSGEDKALRERAESA